MGFNYILGGKLFYIRMYVMINGDKFKIYRKGVFV